MSIHLSMAGFLEPLRRVDRIAKHRLRVSMMGMKELSAYWPVCTWIFQLFAKIIKERSAPRNQQKQSATASPAIGANMEQQPTLALSGFQPEDNFDNWAELTSMLGPMD